MKVHRTMANTLAGRVFLMDRDSIFLSVTKRLNIRVSDVPEPIIGPVSADVCSFVGSIHATLLPRVGDTSCKGATP